MTTISFSVDSSEVRKLFKEVNAAARGPQMGKALLAGAFVAEGNIKRRTPVDTGNLRSSLQAERVDNNTAIVGTPVEYAPHVEYGTSRMSAQPYLRPGLEESQGDIVEAVAATLRKAIG